MAVRRSIRQKMEENMRRTTANDDTVFNFEALLHPGTAFDHPRDIVANSSLTLSEMRAILASWASDASAIASCPALRSPAGLRKPVTIDDILEAMRSLDSEPPDPPGGTARRLRSIARVLAA
jgi:hypothetical protein